MADKSSSNVAASGKKVLVVEDQTVINHMLASLLEQSGYVVGVAEDGMEAINMYNKDRPDLVLMDIYMPHLSGLDAMRAIYKINPDAKIVIISSDGHQDVISKAMKLGAVDYIVKPIKAARLMQVVHKYLV